MKKKKAIKIAAATAIAASAFTAVASTPTEAATSLTSQIKTAQASIKKPFDTFNKATKLVSSATVNSQVKAAVKAKSSINSAIKKEKLSTKTKNGYYAQIKAYDKYLTYAQNYVKGYDAAKKAQASLNAAVADLKDSAAAGQTADVKSQYNALKTAVANAEKAIAKTVYGSNVRTLLNNQFTKATKTALAGELKVAYNEAVQAEKDAAVESVSAINETTVEVTFDKEVTAEDAQAIKVSNGSEEVVYIAAVEGKVATLTLEAPYYVGTTLTVEFDGVAKEVTGTVADPELTDVDNATKAVEALEEAAKDLKEENIENAITAVATAKEALKAVDTDSVKEELVNRIDATEGKIADAIDAAKVKVAQDAVVGLEAAVTELKDEAAVTAAEAAVTKAQDAVKALPEGNENIAGLTEKVDAAKATIATAKADLAKVVVAEVGAITKTNVTVKLEAAVAKAADFANYTVTVGGKAVEVTAVAKDATDETGLTYKLAVNLDGLKGEVKVNGVAAAAAVDFSDKVAPTVDATNSKVTDYKTLTVAFDEAVKGTATVKVNGTDVAAANITLAEDGKTLTIKNTAGYAAGSYNVVVTGLTDKVGNALDTTKNTVTITKAASVIGKVEITSNALAKATGASTSTVYFDVYDQYGQKQTALADGALTFKAVYNGFPVDEKTSSTNSFNVTLNSTGLVKDRVIEVKAYKTVDSKLVEVGTSNLTVKEEAVKASTISNIAVSKVNTVTSSDLSDLKAGDTFELTSTILDQFNNLASNVGFVDNDTPADGRDSNGSEDKKLRWTTSDKSVVAFNADNTKTFLDGANYADFTQTFKVLKQGSAVITAYLPDGSVFKEFTVSAGQGKVSAVATGNADLTVENKKVTTTANLGVNVTDADVKDLVFTNANNSEVPVKSTDVVFEVVAPNTTGFAAADVTVEKVEDASGYLTGVKVTTNRTALTDAEKAGNYGTGFDYTVKVKSTVTGVAERTFTVTSKIDKAVASVSDVAFSANEVTASGVVNKSVDFFNKYGEKLNVKASAVTLASNDTSKLPIANKLLKTVSGAFVAGASSDDLVTGVQFTPAASALGEYTLLLTTGVISKSVKVNVVEAGVVKEINLDKTAISVITGDTLDETTASSTDQTVIIGGATYKVIPVSFKDQYGNKTIVKGNTHNIVATGTAAGTQPVVKYLSSLANDATDVVATNADAEVKYVAIAAESGDTSQNIDFKVYAGQDATTGTALSSSSLNVTVQAVRALDRLSLDSTSANLTVGSSKVIKLTGKDQYDRNITINHSDVNVVAAANQEYSAVVEDDGNGAKVTITALKAGVYAPEIYVDTVTNNDLLDPTEKKTAVSITAKSVADAVDHIVLQPTVSYDADTTAGGEIAYDAANYKVKLGNQDADQNLTFTVKAFDANNNEVTLDQSGVLYSVVSGNLVSTTTSTNTASVATSNFDHNTLTLNTDSFDGDEDVTGMVTVRATTVNGKSTTLSLNLSSAAVKAQAGTYYFATTANGVDANGASTKITSLSLDDTNHSATTVNIVAVDQYGKAVNVDESVRPVLATSIDDSSKVAKLVDGNNGIQVSGKAVGSTTLRAILDGNDPLALAVNVVKADATGAVIGEHSNGQVAYSSPLAGNGSNANQDGFIEAFFSINEAASDIKVIAYAGNPATTGTPSLQLTAFDLTAGEKDYSQSFNDSKNNNDSGADWALYTNIQLNDFFAALKTATSPKIVITVTDLSGNVTTKTVDITRTTY